MKEIKTPKGITVECIYEPDMARMVKALRIVLEAKPPEKAEQTKTQETERKEGAA